MAAEEVTFLKDARFDMDRLAVAYHAERGDGLIRCFISVEALQDGWPRDQGSRAEDTFEAHRAEIEEITRRLIAGGRFESDGSIGVRSADVRHLTA